jgi:N5-(carboxyethyl)ornithine synthase
MTVLNKPLTDLISKTDIIVNGTLQKPNEPLDFIIKNEKSYLKPGSLIIDVSCDEGMGFFFAKPTTFKKPIFKFEGVDYYAVDHTPSYLWESASRSISAALIGYIPAILSGRAGWQKNETIRRAINIDAGVIKKSSILSFQKREHDYPHMCLGSNSH